MCIIAVKKEGVDMPNDAIIKKMFRSNKDGAGFMVKRKRSKLVKVSKGHMTIEDFMEAIKKAKIKKTDIIVMHFRITTAGGTSPELTHPFIADTNVDVAEALEASTDQLCITHNGTISEFKGIVEDRSDSSILASRIMSSAFIKDNLEDPVMAELIELRLGTSRLAVINPAEHKVYIFGEWSDPDKQEYKWNQADDGMIYSNHSWVIHKGRVHSGYGGDFYGDGDQYSRIGFQYPNRDERNWTSDDDDDDGGDVNFPFTSPAGELFPTEADKQVILNDFNQLDLDYQESFLEFMELSMAEFITKVNGGMTAQEYVQNCVDWCNSIGISDGSGDESYFQIKTEDGWQNLKESTEKK